MNKKNETIELHGREAIYILGEIEYMLISLNNIARYYFNNTDKESISEEIRFSYFRETTKFIDNNNITYRLADIRKIITKKFNDELGYDDMDDIEREMAKIKFWEKPGD